MTKRNYSYGTDIFDTTMALDNPLTLNRKGKRKRRSYIKRGFIAKNQDFYKKI
jgi:hypothetical protein